jgi:type IV pilus assembly protein PilC
MKLFYKAVDTDGKIVSGLINGKGEKEVVLYLREHELVPIKIMPANKKGVSARFAILKKPGVKDRIFFTRQMSSMLTSGLTLMQGLEIVKNQSSNPVMEEKVQDIISQVEGGDVFSAALQKHPDLFPPIYVALVKSSETSGLLDKALLRLAENLEKQEILKRKIRSALLYPIIVVVVMILVIAVMMIFVIPQLTVLYESLNVELPLTTRIVLGISSFTSRIWYIFVISILIGGYFFRRWYKKESGRRFIDGYILKLPIFGKLIRETMLAEFTRTLGLMIGSGSLVVDALVKSSGVVSNILYKDAILLVSKRVEKGIAMGDAMGASPLFPSLVVEMVRIGERTGKLDESLMRSSDYFESEVDQTVKNITTLIEPIVIVFLAVGVGFLIFSIITPIYGIISSIQ